MNIRIVLFLLLSIISFKIQAQEGLIYGNITDVNKSPLELINVTLKGKPIGTSTNELGFYEIKIPANQQFTLIFSSVTHQTIEKTVLLKNGQRYELNLSMAIKTEELSEIEVEDKQVRKSTLHRLDPRLMSIIPEASGNFEAMLKTLPGVSSNNELSSQYSVRGGSFDENLVYVNGIEIYRPFLIRSGQQEGMSFINSEMVSSVLFSAGGFDAKYGDKMSSALDIKYKKPVEWGGAASASLLGGSLMIQGDNKSHRFRHISGIRYKTSKYILNSLETEGDYDPRFIDVQTFLGYDITDKLEMSFLGNYAKNSYKFVPQTRTTIFGTIQQSMQVKMYFEGQEVDAFQTMTGALAFDYKASEKLKLSFIASAFSTDERETFDILTQYWINQIDTEIGSETMGDSIANLGIGTNLEHARNYLYATVIGAEHKGLYSGNHHLVQWGVKAQQEKIEDNLREWQMIDSSGYSRPYTDSVVSVNYFFKAKNSITSQRASAFLQDSYTLPIGIGEFQITAGVRAFFWNYTNEFKISPRVNLAFKPKWESDIVFKFSTGYYYQPAFYKEMRSRNGVLNSAIESQKSKHFVLGTDFNFKAWGRPFKLVAEAYYKNLENLISYSVDNVRIIYSGNNDADGYAAGFDIKVNGEFVKGVDSWFSLSIMKTEEDIRNDSYTKTDDDGIKTTTYPGYIPRPSDQRVNLGVFFQDYFPGFPDYKMHLQINFGTGLPFGPPNSERYMATTRMKSYQRVDLGFSKILKKPEKQYPKGHLLYHVKDAWISAEVFNLMDRQNTISHEWVTDFQDQEFAVENSLTGRRINVKLSVYF